MSVVMEEQTIGSQTLMERAGVSHRRVDHWSRRGWLKAAEQTPGSGQPREYLEQEVAVAQLLAVIGPWRAHGSLLSEARILQVCEYVRGGGRGRVRLIPGVVLELDVICT